VVKRRAVAVAGEAAPDMPFLMFFVKFVDDMPWSGVADPRNRLVRDCPCMSVEECRALAWGGGAS
jgi:hypothetical protein